MTVSVSPGFLEDRKAVIDAFARRHRFKWYEAIPWLVAVACYFAFDSYHALGAQIFATILFALSLDLLIGFAGIVTLGHAAFFGVGAYAAGIMAANGWHEPFSELLVAAVAASVAGFASGMIVLRTAGLTLLMQTLVVAALLQELANKWSSVTGGSDGLLGMKIDPVFGLFRFDLFGDTAYVYCLTILFIGWLIARNIVYSSFGRSLPGIRENPNRMHSIGAPVDRRKIAIYTIAAALAGLSGALIAQTTALVGLNTLALSKSGELIIMLVIGGVGQLYGAFIGVPLYMIAQDRFSQIDPIFWYFWIGLFMIFVVVFARGGVLGVCGRFLDRRRSR